MKTRTIRVQIVELDTLLYGNPTWDQVVEFWKQGEFGDEGDLVDAIKRHLRTEAQRELMHVHDITIVDILNGRCCGSDNVVAHRIMGEWNVKLGYLAFHY